MADKEPGLSSGVGLVRYMDSRAGGPQLKPMHVMVFCVLFVLAELALKFLR